MLREFAETGKVSEWSAREVATFLTGLAPLALWALGITGSSLGSRGRGSAMPAECPRTGSMAPLCRDPEK